MRLTAIILALLFSAVSAQAGTVRTSKVVCSGQHPPLGAPGSTLLWGSGVGTVDTRVPPGFKIKKVYCEVSDPVYGLKACKYSKKPDKSCPNVVSKGMLVNDYGDGFKDLSWYVESPNAGPRLFILTTEIAPDAPKPPK